MSVPLRAISGRSGLQAALSSSSDQTPLPGGASGRVSYTREREKLRQNWRERAYTGGTPGKFEWFPL